jgi:RNA polymerase sigma-70 factor (ECF subfamily)
VRVGDSKGEDFGRLANPVHRSGVLADESMAADREFAVALDRLVEHDYVRLVRAVALFSGTLDGAEDAIQEALARAMEQSRRGRDIDCLEAWVVTTAFNHVRSRFRRGARGRERGDGADRALPSAPDAEALGSQLLDLRAAVRSLPTRQREAVVLHYYLDQSISTVGDALGIGEGAVKNALHKARGTLLAALTVDDTRGSTR